MNLFGIDFLWLELSCQHQAAMGDFQQFRDPIFSASTDDYTFAGLLHGLVMEAIDHK